MPTFANREALSSVRAKLNSAIERIDAYGVPSILSYSTLAEFQAAVTAGLTMADGLPVVAAGEVYVADSTAAITGLPAGWRNAGYVYTYAQVEAWATAFQAGSQYIVVNEDGYYVAYERDPTAASTDLTTAFGEAFIKRGLGATDLATLAADVANSIRQNAVSGIGVYGGTADAFTLTVGSGYAVIPTRYTIKFRATTTNTGAATVAVDGLPAVALRTVTGVALPAGYLRTDVDTTITYDGTYWVVDAAVPETAMTRAQLVAYVTGRTFQINMVMFAGGLAYRYIGTGTAIADMPGWVPDGDVTPQHFGAAGVSGATDTAATQACVTYCIANDLTMVNTGLVIISSTVTINGRPRMRQRDKTSYYRHAGGNWPMFDVVTTATTNGFEVVGVRAMASTLLTDVDAAFMRFSGGAGSTLLQRGLVADNYVENLTSGFIFNMDSRVTGSGNEGGLNWTTFSRNHFVNVLRAYDVRKGTGTGNTFLDDHASIRDGYEYMLSTGTYVMGDVVISGLHGNSVTGTCAAVRITGTTAQYLGQWAITGCQFDAGMTLPVVCDSTLALKNFTLLGNNIGGAVDLGLSIAPVQNPQITDRDFSEWKAGKTLSRTTVGVQSVDVFEVTLNADSYNSVRLDISASASLIPGVGPRSAGAVFVVSTSVGTMTVSELSQWVSINSTGSLAITVTSVSATVARIAVGYNQTSAGTSKIHINAEGSGSTGFKIRRL